MAATPSRSWPRDIAGNISDPTTVSWDVQRGAPVTSINSGPDGLTKLKTASFRFSSNKDDSFEYKARRRRLGGLPIGQPR